MMANKILPVLAVTLLSLISNLSAQSKSQVDALIETAVQLREQGDSNEALKNAEQALAAAKTHHFTQQEIDASIELSINTDDSEKRFHLLRRALSLAQKSRYERGEGTCYNELGNYYKNTRLNYDSALICYYKALKIRGESNNPAEAASSYNNLSSVYLELHRAEDARECILKSIALYQSANNQEKNLLRTYNNCANVFEELQKLDSAVIYNEKTLNVIDHSKDVDTTTWIDATYGLGKRLLQKKQYAEAKSYFQKCLLLAQETGDTVAIGMAYEGLGTIEFARINLNEAQNNFQQAISMYLQVGDSLALADVYSNLGNLYQLQEEYSLADSAYGKAGKYLNGKVVSGLPLADVIEQDKVANDLAAEKERQKRRALFTIGLILILTFLFLFRWFKSRRENIVLKEKVLVEKEKALLAQQELNETNKTLLDVREGGVRDREEIQRLRDLHHLAITDHLDTILVYLKSGNFNLYEFRSLVEESIDMLRVRSNESPDGVALGTFTEQMRTKARFKCKMEVGFSREIDDALEYQITGQVRHNLSAIVDLAFSNIRKHANCTTASLHFEVEGNSLSMIIKDDGDGFDQTVVREGARGVADIQGKANEMDAVCIIDTAPGQGTTITIQVPSPFLFETPTKKN